jgi:hypothetical protein
MADAIVESKGGQTIVAYTKDEGDEVSMNDAIKSVDKAEEARQAARQAAFQHRRNTPMGNNQRRRRDDYAPRNNTNRFPTMNKEEVAQDVVDEVITDRKTEE